MAAQGHNTAARPAHVAQQQLQDAGGAYDLHAGGVLRPAQRVGDASGPLASGVGAEQIRDAQKLFRLAAAHLGNDLRRVALEVPAKDLHYAARMLQRWIAGHVCSVFVRRSMGFAATVHGVTTRVVRPVRLRRVILRRATVRGLLEAPMALLGIIGFVLLVEAAKQPCEIFGVPETFLDDGRGIGVGQDIFMKPTVVRQDVVHEAAEESDVAAGADAHVKIADGRHAGEARIDVDEGPTSRLGLHGPAETDRLSLSHVRSHEEDAIAIGHVLLIICGRAAAERGAQTGHRGAVSYSRLVLDRHDS